MVWKDIPKIGIIYTEFYLSLGMKRLFQILIFLGVLLFFLFWLFLYKGDISEEEMNRLYTNEQSKFVEMEGMRVHYRIEGNGPPLVLVHGTAASLHTWDDWTQLLQKDFTIIRMDIPAFGLTGPDPDRDYSIKSYTKFVDQFVNKMNIDSFYLAGNSLGGNIAWNYTIAHPEKVKKLILIDAAGIPSDRKPPQIIGLAQNPIVAPLIERVLPKALIRKNIEEVYYDDSKITDELVERYYKMALREGGRQAFIDRANTVMHTLFHRIDEIACPTLVMWGKHDEWILLEDAQVFDKKITNSKLIVYEDAGHIPMEEIPQKSAEDVRLFLLEEGD